MFFSPFSLAILSFRIGLIQFCLLHRWFARDRPDKAKEILVKYHGDGNPDSPIVALEMAEMQQVVSSTGSDKRFWDFRDLFNTPGARYRTLLVVCVSWFSEIELPPTSYYLPLMGNCLP